MKQTFEGCYYKQQANGKTLALIPCRLGGEAYVCVITDNESFIIPFDISEFHKSDIVRIGESEFSYSGLKVNINSKSIDNRSVSIKGELKYANLVPINGDIMGFFRFFPMECRHGIVSMKHDTSGEITLNGEKYNFDNGIGYIETERGTSFPESYSWVQTNDFKENCSISAAIAIIPFAGFRFWGCICVVWHNGKEYRLATYKGAKIVRCEDGLMEIKQGKYHLVVRIKQQNAHTLPAPKHGVISLTMKESASCPAEFTFTENGKTIFSGESGHTSYEYRPGPTAKS